MRRRRKRQNKGKETKTVLSFKLMLVTLTSLLYSVSLASVLLPFVAQELPLGEPHRSKSVVGHIYTNLNKDN